MLAWLENNWGTLVVLAAVVVIMALIIRSMIMNKKKGKSSCGCGCADCAMNGACHTSRSTDKSAENKTTENESSPDLPESAAEEK